MAWVYVIRGSPAGSGDCIFKNGQHACPSYPPESSTQGMCTAGRGHEPVGHKCRGGGGGSPPSHPGAMPPVHVVAGESLDVRIYVDRPVVEMSSMGKGLRTRTPLRSSA